MKKNTTRRIERKKKRLCENKSFQNRKKDLEEHFRLKTNFKELSKEVAKLIPSVCLRFGLNPKSEEDLKIVNDLILSEEIKKVLDKCYYAPFVFTRSDDCSKEQKLKELQERDRLSLSLLSSYSPDLKLEVDHPQLRALERLRSELFILRLWIELRQIGVHFIDFNSLPLSNITTNLLVDENIVFNSSIKDEYKESLVHLDTIIDELNASLQGGGKPNRIYVSFWLNRKTYRRADYCLPKLLLQITPETTMQEIKNNWALIKERKQQIFGTYKQLRKRKNLDRDVQFYEWQQQGLTYQEIVIKWNNEHPDKKIDTETRDAYNKPDYGASTVKSAIDRFEKDFIEPELEHDIDWEPDDLLDDE